MSLKRYLIALKQKVIRKEVITKENVGNKNNLQIKKGGHSTK